MATKVRKKTNFQCIELEIKSLKDLFVVKLDNLIEKVSSVDDQTKKTNGRVTELEKLREQAKGASVILKGIWGLIAFLSMTACGLVFKMYTDVQHLNSTVLNKNDVRGIVQEELRNVTLEEI